METKKLNQFLLSLSEEHIIGGAFLYDFPFLKLDLKSGALNTRYIFLYIKIEEELREIIKEKIEKIGQELSTKERAVFYREMFKKYTEKIKKKGYKKIEYSDFTDNLLFQFPLKDMLTEVHATLDSAFYKFKFNEFNFITIKFDLIGFSFAENNFFEKIKKKKIEIEKLKLLNGETDFFIKNYNCNDMELLEERIKKRNEEIEKKFKEHVDIYKDYVKKVTKK